MSIVHIQKKLPLLITDVIAIRANHSFSRSPGVTCIVYTNVSFHVHVYNS